MGKILDYLKAAGGEASLHSRLGTWRQKISEAVDAPSVGGAALFDWAQSGQVWSITSGNSADIADAAISFDSTTGRVRVNVEFAGSHGVGSLDVVAVLLIDGADAGLRRFKALPDVQGSARSIGWWVLNPIAGAHLYTLRILNNGGGTFSLDPPDSDTQYIILSVEDVHA